MASARKKQDEKHLKILRDLVSNPSNRQCFDCHQRGPTYVNMTIGSFVCTSCSGLLRGLTPPHRVKSISMATFTPEEIELVSSRGNEYCRRIWLGLYEPGRMADARDEQGIKDFMIAKYEKKRYYLDPSMANFNGASSSSQTSSPNSTLNTSNSSNAASAISPVKPLSSLVGSVTLPALSTVSQPIPVASNSFTPDDSSSGFLVDFASLTTSNSSKPPENKVDPFGLPSTVPTNSSNSSMNFADFDNNPIFGATNGMPSGSPLPTSQSFPGVSRKAASGGGSVFQQPPSEDRYAALKDLDSLMKSQQPDQSAPSGPSQSDWAQGSSSASPSWAAFGTSPQMGGFSSTFSSDGSSGPVTSNPFTNSTSNPWGVSDGGVANPFLTTQSRQNEQPAPFSWNGSGPSVGLNGSPSVNGFHLNSSPFPTSQSLVFPSKTWKTEQVGNPFVMGPSPSPGGHSNNPFL